LTLSPHPITTLLHPIEDSKIIFTTTDMGEAFREIKREEIKKRPGATE